MNSTASAAADSLAWTRQDFPILDRRIGEHPLIFLDSAASSQKPRQVVEAMSNYYYRHHANVHRGAYRLSREATDMFESVRERLAGFLGASTPESTIFTRNTTEAINLAAQAWGLPHLQPGDEIIVTVAEHHANLVPWHLLAARTGAVVRGVRVDADLRLDLDHYRELLCDRTRLVAVAHMNNFSGLVNPVRQMADLAHEHGAVILVDGAQGAPHLPVDVTELDADFYTVSGHKMCGPTGAGALYVKPELLADMEVSMGGGSMVTDVFVDHSSYKDTLARFEPGTPAIAEVIGLGAALDYLQAIGMERVHEVDAALTRHALRQMRDMPGIECYGPEGEDRGGIISFNVTGLHAHDVAAALDQVGIAVRSGKHCVYPLLRQLDRDAAVRASFYFYNTEAEIDEFVRQLSLIRDRRDELAGGPEERDCSAL